VRTLVCTRDCNYQYARRMGQPTQRATNYTARSNIDTAQIFLHANGQRPKRVPIRQRSRRRQRRGEPHTEHGLGGKACIVWCMAYKRGVGEASSSRKKTCNSIAIVRAVQAGGGNQRVIDSCTIASVRPKLVPCFITWYSLRLSPPRTHFEP